jgi:phosphomannomutase
MSQDAPLMLSVSGCRGIFGKTITPEVAARFAGVLGGYLRERTGAVGGSGRRTVRPLVVLGRDGRVGGELLAQAASAGLAAAGCDVLDLGVAMTPTVGVIVDARGAAGGLVVTASHNPQHWNGLKPMLREAGIKAGRVSASAPSKAFADELISRYYAATRGERPAFGPTQEETGSIARSAPGAMGFPGEAVFTHLSTLRAALNELGIHDDRRSLALRCVVDSVNASGVVASRELLGSRLVHHLGSSDSGVFPHTPEPTKENLGHLCRFVAQKKADVGFAQDPDADRLAIVDERGAYIGEEYTLALCAEAVLGSGRVKAAGAVLVTNMSTSRMLEDVAEKHGARVVRTPVGEANVVEAMKAEGAVLGGEGNGGVIWPRVTFIRDSASAMGLVLGLMARTGKPISALVAEIPSYAIVKRKVDLANLEQAKRAVEAVAKAFSKEKLDRRDGVRVDLDSPRSWVHVRASNTEPIMRLIAEAPTTAQAESLLDRTAEAIAKG